MAAGALETSAEPKDLLRLSLDRAAGIRTLLARPPAPSSFSRALPSFLCLLGRDPRGQRPSASGREGGRGWLGGGLPPGMVTLPGPRIAPGPKPRALPGTRHRGSPAGAIFTSCLSCWFPPPDVLLHSLTLEPLPALTPSPPSVDTGVWNKGYLTWRHHPVARSSSGGQGREAECR